MKRNTRTKSKPARKPITNILRCRGIEIVDDEGNVALSLYAFTDKERAESEGQPIFAGIAFHDKRERGDIVSQLTNADARKLEQMTMPRKELANDARIQRVLEDDARALNIARLMTHTENDHFSLEAMEFAIAIFDACGGTARDLYYPLGMLASYLEDAGRYDEAGAIHRRRIAIAPDADDLAHAQNLYSEFQEKRKAGGA